MGKTSPRNSVATIENWSAQFETVQVALHKYFFMVDLAWE
jgi:hypothetical protein